MIHYPRWKYALLILIFIMGVIYALPNVFGEDPSVQISPHSGYTVNADMQQAVITLLKTDQLTYTSLKADDKGLLIRFKDADTQIKANDLLQAQFQDHYTTALNLADATPAWLSALGARPMKLGLDLQGGIHFLLAIDMDSLLNKRMLGYQKSIADALRTEKIRYTDFTLSSAQVLQIHLLDASSLQSAMKLINKNAPDLLLVPSDGTDHSILTVQLTPAALIDAQNNAIEQTMTILRKRINALGLSEAIVQRQGTARIAIDLPGVQDTARAKEILGGTATVEFHLVDPTHDPRAAVKGSVPAGDTLYYSETGQPVLLQNQVVLSGSSITNATSTYGEDGKPTVNIWLGGGGESQFYRFTGQHIGDGMATVYIETTMTPVVKDGKTLYQPVSTAKVINIATIQSALPNTFQISGLSDPVEARNLALLLRSGALPTAISIIEESTVGPSLGKNNIKMGVFSVEIGLLVIVLFMAAYYRLFGIFADIALVMNLVLLIAALSIIGATLTLPGIAGIVLTMGMAVDANVLIFERIREEIRNGISPHACIEAGYEKALSTIIDANVTTLIAALALFGIGTGAVKGFAITLTLGILISMFTAIMGTRAMVYVAYGKQPRIKRLSIGI